MKLITTLLLVFAFVFGISGQNYEEITRANQIFQEKPEVYLSINKNDLTTDLLMELSLDFVKDEKAFLYANKESFKVLIEEDIDFIVERSPGEIDFDPNMKTWEDITSEKLRNTWDFYPTYEAYVAMMYQFETDFPDLVKIYNIGETVLGRDLLYAKLTSNVNEEKAVPRFNYSSTMHGDETVGFVLLLRLIDYFTSNYGQDDDITYLLDNVEIWICPNENPDGTYTNNNSTVSGATRGNANGVDLNRNYPNPVSQHNVQQPETVATVNFVDTMNFTLSANMHGGIELVNYPFDSWASGSRPHVDDDWLYFVSREYADTAQYYSPSGYMTAYGGVTHGGDWYVIYGSRQDYLTYYTNTRELTLELSNTKLLPPEQLPAHWEYNYRSFLNYIWQVTYGITGIVKDVNTQQGVVAEIEILNHDDEVYSTVFSREPFGSYNRPLIAGTYDVMVTAEGYDPVVFENVEVQNFETVHLNVFLGDGITLTLSTNPEGAGTVSGAGVYPVGHDVQVNAEANEGYVFAFWTKDDIEINNSESFFYTIPNEDVTLSANFIELGDVNYDGVINVIDIVLLVNYILGDDSAGFYSIAADVTGDGEIDIADVVAITNIILEIDRANSDYAPEKAQR